MKIHHSLLGVALSLGMLGLTNQEPKPAPEPEPVAVVGDDAPSITLNQQDGTLATIGGESDNWTVLAFYPKALTGG